MFYLKSLMTTIALFVFIFIISCAPGKVLTKDSSMKQDKESNGQEDKYSYNEDNNSNDNTKIDKGLKDGTRDYDGSQQYTYESADREAGSDLSNDREVNYSNEEKFYQKGVASWYGREFQGSITASGERFDMNKLTAAHRSLSFGTELLVKNLENGKSVRVVVNDRGPYRDGRILDLSHAAAQKLDMIAKGEANIGIIITDKTAKNRDKMEPVAGKTSDKDYYNEYNDNDGNINEDSNDVKLSIQAGAFYSRRNAEKIKNQIEEITGNPAVIVNENYMYKVKVDGLNSRYEAEKCRNLLLKKDISAFIIENRE